LTLGGGGGGGVVKKEEEEVVGVEDMKKLLKDNLESNDLDNYICDNNTKQVEDNFYSNDSSYDFHFPSSILGLDIKEQEEKMELVILVDYTLLILVLVLTLVDDDNLEVEVDDRIDYNRLSA
jgi:hypothetical protein